jgi:exodeoxyribonuclease VII large subunit
MLGEFFSDVWIEGEISNFKAYPSGHLYFGLKDTESQIQAVCFRQSARRLKFEPEDGLLVIGHGRLEVYAPTGKYQIVLDTIEPKGLGALQKAFEQLKKKLEAEGLFAAERKRALPVLPRVVGIVTSPAGAAIHDMLRTLRLHKAHLKVLLFPAQVQGEGAAEQIAEGIKTLSSREDVDVIIAGRGGGSIEDLWAFNEEIVARAIAASRVPVISGVGHEVDFTIADFVADVRAATPTAAAQLVAQGWEELEGRLDDHVRELVETLQEFLFSREQALEALAGHRCFDMLAVRVAEARHRVERFISTAGAGTRNRLADVLAACNRLAERLNAQNPVTRILRHRVLLHRLAARMETAARGRPRQARERFRLAAGRIDRPVRVLVQQRAQSLAAAAASLDALSPLASLNRGYSICRKPDGAIVSRVRQVAAGDDVSVRVSDGSIQARVRDVDNADGPIAGRARDVRAGEGSRGRQSSLFQSEQ